MNTKEKKILIKHSLGSAIIMVVGSIIYTVLLWNNYGLVPILMGVMAIGGHFDWIRFIRKL